MATSPKQVILLVDDERNLVRVLEARLRREGYGTLTASDGAEALTVLRGHAVDAVVLDVQMAGLSGHETLKAIRAIRPGLPVILMSAYGKPEGLAQDVTYLEKPFNLDTLISTVATALTVRRAATDGGSVFTLFSAGQAVRLVVPDGEGLCYGAGWVQSDTEDVMEVNAPVREGRPVIPVVGAAVRVTLTGRDGLYSFNTRVEGTSDTGANLLLSKPNVIERHQRRHDTRRATDLPVSLHVVPPSSIGRPVRVPATWQSVNLSDGGMMIAGEGSIPANSDVLFTVTLPGAKRAVNGQARVVWGAPAPTRRSTMGLQFTSLAEPDHDALVSFLQDLRSLHS